MTEIIKNYLEELKKVKKSLANEIFTLNHFTGYLKAGKIKSFSLSVQKAEGFKTYLLNMKKYVPETIRKALNSMRCFYRYLLKKGVFKKNPFTNVRFNPLQEREKNSSLLKIQKDYLEHLKQVKKSLDNDRNSMRLLAVYVEDRGIGLFKLKIKDAQEFQSWLMTILDENGHMKYRKTSIEHIISSANGFYEYLKKRKKVLANPFKEVKRVKKGKLLPKNILDEQKMNRLLKNLHDFWKGKDIFEKRRLYRSHVVAELLYSTGMSINEAARLKTEDIDLKKGTVQVKGRTCFLNEYAKEVLKLYLTHMRAFFLAESSVDKMFASKKDSVFGSVQSLKEQVNRCLRQQGEVLKITGFTTRNLRHALGHHLLKSGADIRYVKEILGHKKINSTQVYLKMDKKNLKNVLDKFHPRQMRES